MRNLHNGTSQKARTQSLALKTFNFPDNCDKKFIGLGAVKDKMRHRDIVRLWAQIVNELGEDKYTSQQWQEGYDDFWRSMLSNSEPYIRIESVSRLKRKHSQNINNFAICLS